MINTAKKILDYWLTLEFLSQDEFPFKNIIPLNNKSAAYEYYDFAKNEVQKKIAEKEFKKKNVKPTWGDFTFYIGKVKREECLERIVEFLPDCKKDYENRVERSANDIAVLSLQLTSSGEYKKNTLRVSPILWAINKLETNENFLSNAKKTYDADIKKLEEKFFVDKRTKDLEQEKEEKEYETECNIPKLSECAVTLEKLHELYSEVIKCFIPEDKDSDKNKSCYDVVMRVNFYESDAAKALANDNYTGLGLDFYSDDIKLVLDNVEKLENDVYLGRDILKYITAYTDLDNLQKSRIDVVLPSKTDVKDEISENSFYKQISKLLHIKNSPLGKWPSKFSPAFMQQIAINLAIQKYNSANGKIFSVNGPPGTGKTTLLKEIIVNNIVEKAKLLADYEKADDAFVARPFKEDNGKYLKKVKQWWVLKNDKINDYGILVASCNNAAVENISKELPKSFVNDLRRENEDAELCAIADLFDVDKTESKIGIYNGEAKEREYQKDIYFTDYTKQLFKKTEEKPKENNNANKEVSAPVAEKEPDVWGLISVALGKKDNINNFHSIVLKQFSFLKKEEIDKAKKNYPEVRKQFTEQWQKVVDMQNELASVCDAFFEETKIGDIEKQIFATDEQCEKYKIEINKIESKYFNCNNFLQQLQNEIEEDKKKLEIDRKELEKIDFEIKNLKNE